MSSLLATVVNTTDLLKTVIASIVAGVGVAFIFSLAIYGGTRFADLNREGKPMAATASAALAGVALLAFAATVVVGIVVMTSK